MSDLVNPDDYGVLLTGFSRMRLPEIRQQIITYLQTTTGLTFETRPDSITGQFIDVFAEREATIWELAEAVYHSMYPISAYGVNLDHAVSFAGVKRLFPESSYVWAILSGQEATIISAGAIVSDSQNQESFLLQNNVTISRQECISFLVEIDTVTVGQSYWISIDAKTFSYTAVMGDTTSTIANALYLQMLGSGLELILDTNKITGYKLESISFALQFSTNIILVKIGSSGNFVAQNMGPVEVPANTITKIITTQFGWDTVNNIVDGHMGRNLETDEELRLRYNTGVFRLGAATLNAIQANLEQNVTGIIICQVYENEEDVTDADGRPPHSIEVVASGGNPQQIADQIWLLKAAGIDTFGSTTVQVTDSIGVKHPINFNRPAPVYIWVNAQITFYGEESFPDNGVETIRNIIVNTGNSFGIGKDVIQQRFHGPIYSGVSGIGHITITIARGTDSSTPPAPGAYTSANIPISARELSTFILNNVQVTVI